MSYIIHCSIQGNLNSFSTNVPHLYSQYMEGFKFAFFKFAFEDIGLGTKFNFYHETM